MARPYREILRIASEKLAAEGLSALDHRGGRGESREDRLRSWLRQRVGAAFGVEKAEIVDSAGRTTGQIDAVVFDRQTGACLADEAGGWVVCVEAVAMTIEIKSALRTDQLEELSRGANKGLTDLRRHYKPARLLRAVAKNVPEWHRFEALWRAGVSPTCADEYFDMPRVASAVFAFDGIGSTLAAQHVGSEHIDIICKLNDYTIAKREPWYQSASVSPELRSWVGPDSLGAFLHVVREVLDAHIEARLTIAPDWGRYFRSDG